ncbi:TBC1 domain family member 9B-like, partial [Saccoglossus kowalevskii]
MSSNYICFASRVKSLVYVIIPMREITVVEKVENSPAIQNGIHISTKAKMTFMFANLKDKEFLIQRISDFLARMPEHKKHCSDGLSISSSCSGQSESKSLSALGTSIGNMGSYSEKMVLISVISTFYLTSFSYPESFSLLEDEVFHQ